MNGRSDASTSTDDVKGRPLCLFYFSQPLGVVAAEPPRAAPCPSNLYHPPGYPGYQYSPSPPGYAPYSPPTHMAPAWDSLWAPAPAPAPSSPSPYVSGSSGGDPRAPCRDTLSSSLFSESWFPSSSSSRGYPRRVVPYHALLPPLRLPAPRAPAPPDAWPLRVVQPERFSLPPIELPPLCEPEDSNEAPETVPTWEVEEVEEYAPSRQSRRVAPAAARGWRRALGAGVHKPRRRARTSALRRSLTHLIQRSVKGFLGGSGRDSASSCCVRAALRTLRAAWPPPAPLTARADTTHDCRRVCGSELSSPCTWCASAPPAPAPASASGQSPAPAPACAMPHEPARAGAAPGLLRRRYSVPETIMRKYRLAQQSNDSEEPCAATSPSSSSPPCGGCSARSGPAAADRELMRRSALLRRLWGRAPAPAQRTSRSLHGSSSELRRSPAGSGWATPKRQRLEWSSPRPVSPPVTPGGSPACSDCTFTSHRARSPAPRDPARDVFARYSHLASDAARASSPVSVRSTPDSATLSESLPTALPVAAPPAPAPAFVADGEVNRYSSLPFDVLSAGSPPYEVLEIVVSETVEAPRPVDSGSPARTALSSSPVTRSRANINIDEYVSNILVESLNSLSEQLESMSAAVGGAGVVVEKEIKVRLQNTGVNTIVHLSPTSNHQIIFGNEELVHADNARDACNNPRESPPSPAPEHEPNNNEPPDSVNRAVLQQIQKLFHDELYRLEPGSYPGEPTLTQIESSNVDVYIEHHTDSHSEGSPGLGGLGVGAGNYWAREPALVPRLSALPNSASMEVNTSSSEAEPSACPSLVDSLDDPASPRVPLPVRRLARSAVDVLDLLPEAPPPRDRAEAFFVRIDEDCDCDKENIVVADSMPDRIRERLLRRHRKRELRMESRRGGGGGQERARRRAAEHDARAIVAALVEELVAKIAQEEYKCLRIQRRSRPDRGRLTKNGESPTEEHNGRIETRALHGKLSLPPTDAPRRIYQKSEIHDGDKCIEILEILEYVDDSQNSPETTNSDEHHGNSRSRKSRIPIPIYERIQRTTKRCSRGRRSPPPAPPSPSPPSPPPVRRASVPPPAEPRARAGSLRFRRVFDIIPEERGAGPGTESPLGEDARRGSAPSLPPALPRATRSAATSPPAPQRSTRSTMTSPRRAAPSPPPPPAPRVAAGTNDNLKEKGVTAESKRRRGSVPARAGAEEVPAGPAVPAERPRGREVRSSSSGSDSGGSSLLCAAPRWLAARRRRPRPARAAHTSRASHRVRPASQPDVADGTHSKSSSSGAGAGAGGWSVTVAGSCRAALPADVEMRLRFPRDARAQPRASTRAARPPRADMDATPRRSVATRSDETGTTECWCRCCSCGAGGGAPVAAGAPGAPALPPPPSRRASLTFALKKEDSSTLNRKSRKKCSHTHLPQLEPAGEGGAVGGGGGGGGGERRRRSGKVRAPGGDSRYTTEPDTSSGTNAFLHGFLMRRACSLQCWLPAAPRRAGELAVEGSAIVPELKPRAPTMSERDLTRHHTPRLYLRC